MFLNKSFVFKLWHLRTCLQTRRNYRRFEENVSSIKIREIPGNVLQGKITALASHNEL